MSDVDTGRSIKLVRYEVLIDEETVFDTADPRKLSGVTFGIMVGSGTEVLTAHREVINMGLTAIKEGGAWAKRLEDGRALHVRIAR